MAWHDACALMDDYVVKIQTPDGSGTGFYFAYNADKSLIAIATALHVIEQAHSWRLPLKIIPEKNGKEIYLTYEERGVLIDRKRDSAAIVFQTKMAIEPPNQMLGLLRKGGFKKRGVRLGWCGYPAIAPNQLCFFQGGVSAFNLNDDSYFVDGVAIHGVSGGPVFDEHLDGAPMQIVGLVSAYFANRQSSGALPGLLMAYDVTHLHSVVEQFKDLDEARTKEAADNEKEQKAAPPAPELDK